MDTQKTLFENRQFLLIFIGGFLALIGFSTFFTTTTWFAITELGSASSLGIVLVSITVPRILMMAFGGIIADKFKKTSIMFTTSFIQGCILVLIFVLSYTSSLSISHLVVLGMIFGTLDAFSGPAGASLIPKIVNKNQIQQANAIIQGMGQIGFVVGPIISGSVMEYFGVSAGYLVAATIVLLSALLMFPPFFKEGAVVNKVKQSPLKVNCPLSSRQWK
ncbi:MFS transporter [Alkalihalophilus marmarensis]|uniref:Major facilitator superfamily (MFS) profile domain-containing protein n=1 Tax=Alkalihalophilus marmarensis DSM 21297 TaxID=1188261 RepID=U6SR45_9BACI|nr:MFS transporter [Alkalihalophilus marmarensis]ERN54093.1 hypothetical protein A33I_08980 [Alkalihalophilus marmarensis DSM 21297]